MSQHLTAHLQTVIPHFKIICNYMKYIIYYCFFVIIIVTFAYFNSLQDVESFTPIIREFYRPYIRNARVFGEGIYGKQKIFISNLFRKFGLM